MQALADDAPSEPTIGPLSSIRLPPHIAVSVSPALTPSNVVFSGVKVSTSGTPLMSASSALGANYDKIVRSQDSAPPGGASPEQPNTQPPVRRSRSVSTVHTPNLHPAATPLCRFSFFIAPDSLVLPPPAEQTKASRSPPGRPPVHSRDSPHMPRIRTRTQSSVFAPNLGGSSSGSDDERADGRPAAPRIARIRSHNSMPPSSSVHVVHDSERSASIAIPHRDALVAIALARNRSNGNVAGVQPSTHSSSSTISRLPSIRESKRDRAAEPLREGQHLDDSAAEERLGSRKSPAGRSVSIGVQTESPTANGDSASCMKSLRARFKFSKKTRNLCIIALITLGSGFTMFINGIAGRILPPRPNAYTSSATPLSLRIIASLPDPIYVLTSGRGISLLAVLGCMLFLTGGRAQLDEMSSRMLFPVIIGVFNGLGFCFFCALCAMGNVAIWSAMLAVWIVAPLSYGILVRHESAGKKKVAGAVFCMVAAIVLGLAGSGEGEGNTAGTEEGPVWLKLVLFLFTVSSWSVSDTLSAYVMSLQDKRGRSLGIVSVALFTAIGYLFFAWVAAGVSFLLSSLRPPVEVLLIRRTVNGTLVDLPDGSSIDAPFADSRSAMRSGGWEDSGVLAAYLAPAPSSVLSGNALMFAGNLAGALSWYGIVLLGSDPSAEASTFLPLTALDAFIPAILGTIFLGEPAGALGVTGMVIGAFGVFLIASSESSNHAKSSTLRPPAQGAVQLHDEDLHGGEHHGSSDFTNVVDDSSS